MQALPEKIKNNTPPNVKFDCKEGICDQLFECKNYLKRHQRLNHRIYEYPQLVTLDFD